MVNLVGNEILQVTGAVRGGLASKTETVTTQQIANLGFVPGAGVLPVANGGTGYGTQYQITSGTTNSTPPATGGFIIWNSATTGAKSQTIPTPTAGLVFNIKDKYGSAGTYNITITPLTGTIDGQATYVINQNYAVITLVADANSNNYLVV